MEGSSDTVVSPGTRFRLASLRNQFLCGKELGSYKSHDEQKFTLRILTGNSNPKLAEDISRLVGYEMRRDEDGRILTPGYINGEIDVKLVTCVRGDDIFLIQPMCGNGHGCDVNAMIVELLFLIHAARLASAKRITAVIPYFGYSRQSALTDYGMPIAASAVAKLILNMKVNSVITVDLHKSQIQGFFHNVPVENLTAAPVYVNYFKKRMKSGELPSVDKLAVVALGDNNIARAKLLGDKLGIWRYVTILTRRTEQCVETENGTAWRMEKTMQLDSSADIKGLVCITVDSTVDTAITTVQAVKLLSDMGALWVVSCATHGVLSADSIARLNACEALREVVVTDTTPQEEHIRACPKLTVLTISTLLGIAIERMHYEEAEHDDDWVTEDWYRYDLDGIVSSSASSLESTPITRGSALFAKAGGGGSGGGVGSSNYSPSEAVRARSQTLGSVSSGSTSTSSTSHASHGSTDDLFDQ